MIYDEEAEKTASAYYELGQVMALGFQDQMKDMEKEAAVGRALKKLKEYGSKALDSARKASRRVTPKQERAAQVGVGLATGGVVGHELTKNSYEKGIYDTLDELGLLEGE